MPDNRQFKGSQQGDGSKNPEEEKPKSEEEVKAQLVEDHFARNNPHSARHEVLNVNTVSSGVHSVKFKDENGNVYYGLLLEDGEYSTLLGGR